MATTEAAQGCPLCPRATYAFRVPARFDDRVQLSSHYRCGQVGGWVYIHDLRARSLAAMAGVTR